jgi:hypothetical protein
MEDPRTYILQNLQMTNLELSNATGLSIWKIKYYLRASGITRTKDQLQQIRIRKGELQTGNLNPNWKNGISSDNYHYKKTQMERFPEKIEARRQVMLAIKKGLLIRRPCEVCGCVKSEAHHPDHSRPLEVVWLCRPHHREREKLEILKRNNLALETDVLTLGLYK